MKEEEEKVKTTRFVFFPTAFEFVPFSFSTEKLKNPRISKIGSSLRKKNPAILRLSFTFSITSDSAYNRHAFNNEP